MIDGDLLQDSKNALLARAEEIVREKLKADDRWGFKTKELFHAEMLQEIDRQESSHSII